MTLEHNGDALDVKLIVYSKNARGEAVAVDRDTVDGILRLKDGDSFVVELRNRTLHRLYCTVLYCDPEGRLQILFPKAFDADVPLEPGGTATIGDVQMFDATAADAAAIERYGAERARLKIIATSQIVDFYPLTVEPEVGSPNLQAAAAGARGTQDPLFGLMADVLHGGRRARGVGRKRTTMTWATSTIVFDIEP